jgi:crooked neck
LFTIKNGRRADKLGNRTQKATLRLGEEIKVLLSHLFCKNPDFGIMSKKNSGGGYVVKNRAPAPIQISAEQIVREAADRSTETRLLEPIVKVHDADEYRQHLADRRKQFEDNIRYRREHIGNWVKYARFEEENSEFQRARSIFERALEVDHRSGELWLRYAEFELRHEFLNHARNILDRAVQILPRIDFLWYKYVWVEELAGDWPKTRSVFERWMEWHPDDSAWMSYAKFEARHQNYDAAKNVMQRYCQTFASAKAMLKYAKFAEFELHDIPLARSVYESSISELDDEEITENPRLFQNFANFEIRQGEYERARLIYQHAVQLFGLDKPDYHHRQSEQEEPLSDQDIAKRRELYENYVKFESQHGEKASIELVVYRQRRDVYEDRLKSNPYDYDGWFEYTKMLSSEYKDFAQVPEIRDAFERAVSHVPPDDTNKDHWRRYIYLWIYYAVYEELDNRDLERAKSVYETCINRVIPHEKFTFSKIWILLAKLHLRRHDITAARKLLGRGLGICLKKKKLYEFYISFELALGEIDRCRTLYQNYLKSMMVLPENATNSSPHGGTCQVWKKFAQLEVSIGESERARAIYELGVSQEEYLDQPEVLWKSYIDFEIEEGEGDRARNLYQRLIEQTEGHVKVWISWAQMEATPNIGRGMPEARRILDQAYQQLKDRNSAKEERVVVLDAWRELEATKGDETNLGIVEAKLPRRIKRKRMRHDEDGNELGWEEYFDYHFPDDEEDENAGNNFKILEMAAKWKAEQQQKKGSSDDDEDDSDLDDDDDS